MGEGGRTTKLGEVRGGAEQQAVPVALVSAVAHEIERSAVQAWRPVRQGGAVVSYYFGLALDGLKGSLPVGGGLRIGCGHDGQGEGFRHRSQLANASGVEV